MPTSDWRNYSLWGRSSGVSISRNFPQVILIHINFENHYMEANLIYKLLVPIVSNVSCCQKKQKQKCPFRGLGALSPPGRRCLSSPGELLSPSLSLWQPLIRSFFILAHSSLQSWEIWSAPVPFLHLEPSRPHRWAGNWEKLCRQPSAFC